MLLFRVLFAILFRPSLSDIQRIIQMKKLSSQYPEFYPNQTATEAHKSLISALEIKDAAHQCSLDWFGEIFDRKLYRELGFSSINQYAKDALGFSRTKVGDYIKLTRKLKELPHLKDALNGGKLGYTSGRLIASIANQKSEKEWVGFALENPRKVIEEEVKRARLEAKEKASRQPSLLPVPKKKTPAAVVPVRVQLEMSPTQFARYESLWEQVRKQRNVSSEKVEALLEIMASFLKFEDQNRAPRGDFQVIPRLQFRFIFIIVRNANRRWSKPAKANWKLGKWNMNVLSVIVRWTREVIIKTVKIKKVIIKKVKTRPGNATQHPFPHQYGEKY